MVSKGLKEPPPPPGGTDSTLALPAWVLRGGRRGGHGWGQARKRKRRSFGKGVGPSRPRSVGSWASTPPSAPIREDGRGCRGRGSCCVVTGPAHGPCALRSLDASSARSSQPGAPPGTGLQGRRGRRCGEEGRQKPWPGRGGGPRGGRRRGRTCARRLAVGSRVESALLFFQRGK